MKFTKTLALCALLSFSAFAGERGGNGGDGIVIDGKLYLLDLVEAGVEGDDTFARLHEPDVDVLQRLERKLGNQFPIRVLASKLAQIGTYASPLFARVLLHGIELYNWRLVNSNLVNVRDENTLLDYDNLVQLAIRRNSGILISRSNWTQLDDLNKAALVLHEVAYALVKPSADNKQESVTARELVGHLFSAELGRQSIGGLKEALGSKFNFQWRDLTYPFVFDPTYATGNSGRETIEFNPSITFHGPRVAWGNEIRVVQVDDRSADQAYEYQSYVYNACQLRPSILGHRQTFSVGQSNETARVELANVGESTFLNVIFATAEIKGQSITATNDDQCLNRGARSFSARYNGIKQRYSN